MTKFMIRTIVLGLILGTISVVGMANENKKHVTFDEPVMVNGTLVKAGNYEVVFDDATGQLTIFKGKKEIAKASARLKSWNGIPARFMRPGATPARATIRKS